jgi:hypothetical protein
MIGSIKVFSFLKPYWLDLLKWGGIMGGVLLVLLRVRNSGKYEERNAINVQILENTQEAKETREEVHSLPVDAKRDRLREHWTRD